MIVSGVLILTKADRSQELMRELNESAAIVKTLEEVANLKGNQLNIKEIVINLAKMTSETEELKLILK